MIPIDFWTSLASFKRVPFPPDYPAGIARFYSPDDNVHGALKALLSSAESSLLLSMYGFDDPELTDIIISKAQDPNIFVQINLDKTQAAGSAEVPLVAKLRACPNTRVAVGTSIHGAINHLKVAVSDGLYTLTGSTNWSTGGESLQNNEAGIIRDRAVAHEATMKLNADHQAMLAQEAKATPAQAATSANG